MATTRLVSGQVQALLPVADDEFSRGRGHTLVKTDRFEVARLMVPAGKHIAEHQVAGELTLQCLSGTVTLQLGQETRSLIPGDLVFLAANEPHSVQALTDSVLLLSLILRGAP